MAGRRGRLARAGADAIREAFGAYLAERAAVTARAPGRFAARAWAEGQRDARERLDVRDRALAAALERARAILGAAAGDAALWREARDRFAADVAAGPAEEVARSFFSSVSRRVLGIVGTDPEVEFLASPAAAPADLASVPVRTFVREGSTEALVAAILRGYDVGARWVDLDGDARLAAIELDAHLREAPGGPALDTAELAAPVFYRGKGAYLVGRLRRGGHLSPLLLALRHGERGVALDAALFAREDASIVFSFTRLRELFLQAHGELLSARWWRAVQERLRAGEIADVFPYREDQRLHHARG